MNHTMQSVATALAALLALCAVPAQGYFTMVSAQANSCGGIVQDSDGAVDVVAAAAAADSAGDCGNGQSSSATSASGADIAAASVSVSGAGVGDPGVNGAFAEATFGERLTVANVPAAIDTIDVRVVIDFVATPPDAAFYNSAHMEAYANPQVIPGQARLVRCDNGFCPGGGPVASDSLDEVLTLPRNGLGEFGFIDVFMTARFSIASTQASISGSMGVEIVGVPGAMLVSESGLFGTGGGTDSDGDGVADASDNCTLAANPAQIDTDGDGFGNACDADFNNDCVVNPLDLGYLRSVFFSADQEADLNGDGTVNPVDLGLFRTMYFGAPGPSAVALICNGAQGRVAAR